jgi:hypothetical protein
MSNAQLRRVIMWLSKLLLSQKRSRKVRCRLRRHALVIRTCFFSLAKFIIKARGYTVDDDDLFCVDLKVNFMKGPFFKLPFGR